VPRDARDVTARAAADATAQVAAFDAALTALVKGDSSPAASISMSAGADGPEGTARAVYRRSEDAQTLLDAGEPTALRRAVELYRENVRLVPATSAFRAGVLSDFLRAGGVALQASEDLALVDDLVTVGREALTLIDAGTVRPRLVFAIRSNLAAVLLVRAALLRDSADADEALRVGLPAHALAYDWEALATIETILARAFLQRFDRGRDREDLDHAIGLASHVLEIAPDPTLRGSAALILAEALLHEHERRAASPTPTDADVGLAHAARMFELACAMTAPGSRDRAVAELGLARVAQIRATESYRLNERPASSIRAVATDDLRALDASIVTLRAAVDRAAPPERAAALNALAGALRDRGVLWSDFDNLREATAVQARAVDAAGDRPAELLPYLHNLGRMQWEQWRNVTHERADLEAAVDAWARADTLAAGQFLAAPITHKFADQAQWALMRGRLVTSCVQLAALDQARPGHWRQQALVHAEAAKSRVLTELLGRSDLPAPPSIPPDLAGRERAIVARLGEIDVAELTAVGRGSRAGGAGLAEERRRLVQELATVWQAMEGGEWAAAAYVRLRRGDTMSWPDLQRLAAAQGPRGALLSLMHANDTLVLFAVRDGWSAPEVSTLAFPDDALDACLRAFAVEVDVVGKDFGAETWDAPLRPLFAAAAPHLAGVERIVLAPFGVLHRLPWAVVADRAGLCAADGTMLCVTTVPALSVSAVLHTRPAVGRPPAVVVIGDPRNDLPYARAEAVEVAARRGTTPLLGAEADHARSLAALGAATVAHVAAHAKFEPDAPLDSGLVLADTVLTARELLQARLDMELLVLSACETGRAASAGGDELLGLTQALLQAGVRTLVVSLWPVLDMATVSFMRAFHEALGDGADPASALRTAMTTVKARHAHAYFWGGFVLLGASR
jgi:hypothetical protein